MKRVRLAVVLAVVLAALLRAFSRRDVVPTVARPPEVAARHRAAPMAEAEAPHPQVRPWPAVEAEARRELPEASIAGDPGDAEIAMDVVDEHGLAAEDTWVVPVDCDGLEPGPPRVTRIPTGTCTVRAMRRDGALFARSEPVTVEVTNDDTAYVLLELASTRTGGIGVRFQPDDNGIRVMYVVDGSPADEAGLHAGDLVLDVGGEPTAGMDPDTFVERMTGAEGTDVTFTVGWSDDTGLVEETVTVVRRFLDG